MLVVWDNTTNDCQRVGSNIVFPADATATALEPFALMNLGGLAALQVGICHLPNAPDLAQDARKECGPLPRLRLVKREPEGTSSTNGGC